MTLFRGPHAVQEQVVDLRVASRQAVERGDPRAGSDKKVAGAGSLPGSVTNNPYGPSTESVVSRLAGAQERAGDEAPGDFP